MRISASHPIYRRGDLEIGDTHPVTDDPGKASDLLENSAAFIKTI
jgi:hypothetical protein